VHALLSTFVADGRVGGKIPERKHSNEFSKIRMQIAFLYGAIFLGRGQN
jgi:hypothetical protein